MNCENELRVYSTNEKNLKAVEDSMQKLFKHCTIGDSHNFNLTIYFESRYYFPEFEMNKLIEALPDKSDIYLDCLSVNWDCHYCAFYSFELGNWKMMS